MGGCKGPDGSSKESGEHYENSATSSRPSDQLVREAPAWKLLSQVDSQAFP